LPVALSNNATPILFADDASILTTSQKILKFQDDLNVAFEQISKLFRIKLTVLYQ
jgi:hypothetical protein